MIILLFSLSLTPLSYAQSQLFINGNNVKSFIVQNDELFVSLKGFAEIVNAKYALDFEKHVFSLDFNGHVLSGKLQNGVAGLDGKKPVIALMEHNSELYLGITGLSEAFDAKFDVVGDNAYLVFPRATLLRFDIQAYNDYDRAVLEFIGFSPIREDYSSDINTLNIVFENALEHSNEVMYGNRSVFELGSSKGYLVLKLILAEQDGYSKYFQATENGFVLVIDIFANDAEKQSNNRKLCLISKLEIAQELVDKFEKSNFVVNYYGSLRDSEKLFENELCIAVGASDLPRSQVNVFYLDSEKSRFMIQDNAAKAIGFNNNPERQKVLEKLAANYAFGQALALRIADAIYQTMGYRAAVINENIELLKEFSGKAVYIEISHDDSTNSLLMQTIAQSIINFVETDD